MRSKLILAFVLSFFSFTALADAAAPAAASGTPPDQVVQQTAKDVFDTVNSKKAELQKDPSQLYEIVSKILLPRFDFELSSRYVLGQAWRSATEEQRKAFQDAFFKYLTRSYADALVKGNYSERNVKVEPYRPSSQPDQAMVKTQVQLSGSQPVEVDYVLRNESGQWKAFDVIIEGISYVHSYHDQFAPEIQKSGLDELIKRLSTSKAPNAVPAPATKG
ncbi:MAG TPA: ABC transporter substrate-binding protein [Gammaproteobacteria bacterium]|jgi:phospholipid transport system substrate-binding protein|nr:ABC transporter substrate-binding protein [Gammaproteobacteria bacterium]